MLVRKALKHFDGSLKGKRFALWGLAFKPDTDDMREAPARAILEALWAEGATVQAYDPLAMNECRRIYGNRRDLVLTASPMEAVVGVDALFIATEAKPYRAPNFNDMMASMNAPVIFDGRNLYEPGHGGQARASPTTASAAEAGSSTESAMPAGQTRLKIPLAGGAPVSGLLDTPGRARRPAMSSPTAPAQAWSIPSWRRSPTGLAAPRHRDAALPVPVHGARLEAARCTEGGAGRRARSCRGGRRAGCPACRSSPAASPSAGA